MTENTHLSRETWQFGVLCLGKILSEWGLFATEVEREFPSLEPLGSEVNFKYRLNTTHLATSSETDTAFLRRTALSSGLLLGEGHREGKDWAGLSLSAFSMFSVCWHWNKRAKVVELGRLREKRPKVGVSISTQGISSGTNAVFIFICIFICKPHHWNALLKNKMGLKQTQVKLNHTYCRELIFSTLSTTCLILLDPQVHLYDSERCEGRKDVKKISFK